MTSERKGKRRLVIYVPERMDKALRQIATAEEHTVTEIARRAFDDFICKTLESHHEEALSFAADVRGIRCQMIDLRDRLLAQLRFPCTGPRGAAEIAQRLDQLTESGAELEAKITRAADAGEFPGRILRQEARDYLTNMRNVVEGLGKMVSLLGTPAEEDTEESGPLEPGPE